jgi:NAD+ diphosphatase
MLPDDFRILPAPRPGTLADPLVFAFRDGELAVIEASESLQLPAERLLTEAGLALDGAHFVGEWAGVACLALAIPAGAMLPGGCCTVGLRQAYQRLPEPLLWIAGRALQILEWDRTHRFCGRCGAPAELKQGERARVCPCCGLAAYPRLSPAMMVLITRGRELLLVRSPHFRPGVYSALAGFVEPGETLEQTVVREVREEVGIEIKNLCYFGSQPWPFPHSLMVAFTAEYAGGELCPDGVEIESAHWYDIDRLPPLPLSISIAHRLIASVAARLRSV